ncbi:MAG: hypothetical protein AB2A00_37895 [Myxococcota bacterium]
MSGHPVFVAVRRGDGTIEQVRVGTAYKDGENFRLELGQLTIGGAEVPATSSRPAAARPAAGGGGGGMVFPNYGRSKGMPISGASAQDLEFYANGCRRTLADPNKARWHDKERELLAAIEAEMERQGISGGGGTSSRGSAPRDPGSARWGAPSGEEPPPLSDDDIPF